MPIPRLTDIIAAYAQRYEDAINEHLTRPDEEEKTFGQLMLGPAVPINQAAAFYGSLVKDRDLAKAKVAGEKVGLGTAKGLSRLRGQNILFPINEGQAKRFQSDLEAKDLPPRRLFGPKSLSSLERWT